MSSSALPIIPVLLTSEVRGVLPDALRRFRAEGALALPARWLGKPRYRLVYRFSPDEISAVAVEAAAVGR